MPVAQLDAKLDTALDEDAPPTIYGDSLKPELATAALNLSVDILKQKEALANKHVATHPITLITVLFGMGLYMSNSCLLPSGGAETWLEYLFRYVRLNKRELLLTGLVSCMIASVVMSLVSKFTKAFFKARSEMIVETSGKSVFGLELRALANEEALETEGTDMENTHIIVYRETPIAIVSIHESAQFSTAECLVMNVTTIGCRHVYLKSGLVEDLVDWAMVRTKNIQQKSSKYHAGGSMKLLVEVYSFDLYLKEVLKQKKFTLIKSCKLPSNKVLNAFGMRTELWGIQFHFESKKEK